MLADFIGIDPERHGFRSMTTGYNVDSKEEVLELYDQLKDKVKILKEPTEPPFRGLFFYFADIEGLKRIHPHSHYSAVLALLRS